MRVFACPRDLVSLCRLSHRSEEQLELHAEEKAMLVPIRIELDTETHRIRDCFLWNVNGAPVSAIDSGAAHLAQNTRSSRTTLPACSAPTLACLNSIRTARRSLR